MMVYANLPNNAAQIISQSNQQRRYSQKIPSFQDSSFFVCLESVGGYCSTGGAPAKLKAGERALLAPNYGI